MIGEGSYHLAVPREETANLRFRNWLLVKGKSESGRRAIRAGCRADCLFWINSFVWQINPQKVGQEVGPFCTWGFQDEAVRTVLSCVQGREDLVIEKSREMGASWLCLLVMDWMCRFHKSKKFLLISRSAEAVDRSEDPDCLMWKLDFVDRYMPEWLCGKRDRAKMRIGYATDSRITGQASTGKAGVGGRATAAFVDEFSQIGEDREVLARTADTTGCRIFNFTHTDVGTAAYDLAKPESGVRKLVMHWSQHPEKRKGLYRLTEQGRVDVLVQKGLPEDYDFVRDGTPTGGPYPGLRSPWYDAECRRREGGRTHGRSVAMDLDINPTGASSQFYDAVTISRLKGSCRSPLWRGSLMYVREEGEPQELVEGEGNLWLWLTPGFDSRGRLLRVPQANYVIGGDVGTGAGVTPSCFTVFDCDKGIKVGKLVDRRIDPKTMAGLVVALCRVFRNAEGQPAQLTWECPGAGTTFGNEVLKEYGYRNIFWKTEVLRDVERESDVPGWHSTPKMKLQLHTEYRSALGSGRFANPDESALDECLAYVHKNGSVEHPKATVKTDEAGEGMNHGDQVVGDALAWMLASRRPEVRRVEGEAPESPIPNSMLARRKWNRRAERESDLWA